MRTTPEPKDDATMPDDSDVLVTARANLWRGPESVGGHLTLANGRLSFRAHALNIQTEALDLPVADIASTRKYRSMGFIPNGLAVTTTSGVEYRFVVGHRDRFISGIESGRHAHLAQG
jgi:GRAM domain